MFVFKEYRACIAMRQNIFRILGREEGEGEGERGGGGEEEGGGGGGTNKKISIATV